MKKKSLTILSALLFLWGCTGGGGGNQANNPTPTPTPPPTAQPEEATNQENPEENSDIIVASNASPSTPSGLIAPTDADERLKQINQGRNDPFSVIPPPKAIINITPPAGATEGNNNVSGSSTTNRNTGGYNSTVASAGGAGTGTNVGGTNNSLPSACEMNTFEASEPSIPEPSDAQAVLVSGIINVEGEEIAIVKTPDYSYSYRIRPGSYISNGLVYVKRINSYGIIPSVILEQYGQEVVRRVGDAPIEAKKEDEDNVAFELPFKKEQLNVIPNQVKGLKLVSVEGVRAVKRGGASSTSTQTNQVSQEVIEISGYVCNATNKPISVNEMYFSLSTKNIDLPPLTAYFQGVTTGDISQGVSTGRETRIVQPNRKTLFRGAVINSSGFVTTDKIDIQLSDWE